jgi:hypothetical protein
MQNYILLTVQDHFLLTVDVEELVIHFNLSSAVELATDSQQYAKLHCNASTGTLVVFCSCRLGINPLHYFCHSEPYYRFPKICKTAL